LITLVDTSVWSLALRRRKAALSSREAGYVSAWRILLANQEAALIGIVRQEILSGIKDAVVFDRLRLRLNDMPHLTVSVAEHDLAAQFLSQCRTRGIAASAVDMLICAVSALAEVPILTADKDFSRYARALPISLAT
jgi:predicted nucleic acid-binding protein